MVSIEDLKLPPHNIDAEKGILSGILIDNNMIDIADNVNLVAKDFYSKEHQMIFEMILNLKNAHKTIDAVTAVSYTHLDVYKRQLIYSYLFWFLMIRDVSSFLT